MGRLVAAIGDIHGRFIRVEGWLRELAAVQGRPVELAIAVGDLETFVESEAPLRKRTKRAGAAEFGPFARGERQLPCPLVFVGGNNEDFASLHAMPDGGPLSPQVRYLGRAGEAELAGTRIGFLSGIFAPTSFERPVEPPTNLDLARRAGHFRAQEVARVLALGHVELLLLHDWPRGISGRTRDGPPPFWGNAPARQLVEALHPEWVLCGHQHRAWAASIGSSRIACLAEAERADDGLCWLEIERGAVVAFGWGLSREPAWSPGDRWDSSRAPR